MRFLCLSVLLATACESSPPSLVPTDLPQGQWTEISPGGDTICARGTPFSFFVRPGRSNHVVLDFIGGGACWDETTCGYGDALFSDSVDPVREAVASNRMTGIYNHERRDNPFVDDWHIVVPYCTGDIHWGDSTRTYGTGDAAVTIHHRGAVNARAVLDWMYRSFAAPERVVVTGCSAGSYGSIMWSAHVMEHYAGARVIQFGDSGAGVITEDFFMNSFPSWNATTAFPSWIPELDPAKHDVLSMQLSDIYLGIGHAYPEHALSQYHTWQDENQTFFYTAMGGTGGAEAWSQRMQASMATIHAGATNFSSFLAPGTQHNFYTVNSNGVKLTSFLTQLIDGPRPASVQCQGAECLMPTP
jgi:Pectinacetylesterase